MRAAENLRPVALVAHVEPPDALSRCGAAAGARLFRHQTPGWRHRLRCFLGDRERQPGIPTRRPVGGVEFTIAFQAQKCLVGPDREDISELRTDAEYARAKAAELRRLAEVVGDLLVGSALAARNRRTGVFRCWYRKRHFM